MMRSALLAAAAICCLAGGAQASVTYQLVNPTYDAFTQSVGGNIRLSLTISDAAKARGSFFIQGPAFGNNGPNPTYTGDVADFISFTANETSTPDYLYGRLSLSVSFDAAGAVTGFNETFYGVSEQSMIRGTGASLSGTFGSDNFGFRCGGSDCALVSGQFIQVPEPASMTILGLGLLAAAAVRRRV